MRAAFHQRHERILGNALRPRLAFGRPNLASLRGLVGHVQRAPVNAHHAPLPVPGPGLARPGQRAHQALVQALERFIAQARAGLRDGRVAGHAQPPGGLRQPLQAIQQAAQHLAAGRMHMQRQRHGEEHHQVVRQQALADAGPLGLAQHLVNAMHRDGRRDGPQADVVRDPRTSRQAP